MLAGGTGVKLRTRPAGMIVLERDGREYRVPTPENTRLILWALAGPVREHDYLVVGQVGNRIDGRRHERPPAPSGDRGKDGGDYEPVL